ncbi:MAG: hypothetical protein D6674_06800 [Acidobacteria bacterium]|jgi:hypothetical protein|nr:MAG: hypothetical protein D6674_06800 [Acidobacteriota bacterium]
MEIRRLFLALLLSFLFAIFLALITLPKFLLLDRELSKRGIYLTAGSVKEGLRYVELKDVVLYGKDSRLVSFERLSLSFGVPYVEIYGSCRGGSLRIKAGMGYMEFKLRDFACLEEFGKVSGDLTLKRGIFGRLTADRISVQGVSLEGLSLDFRGRTFLVQATAMGFKLIGDGQVVLDRRDILKSKINGRLSGGGLAFTIGGNLYKLELKR